MCVVYLSYYFFFFFSFTIYFCVLSSYLCPQWPQVVWKLWSLLTNMQHTASLSRPCPLMPSVWLPLSLILNKEELNQDGSALVSNSLKFIHKDSLHAACARNHDYLIHNYYLQYEVAVQRSFKKWSPVGHHYLLCC